mmetsp:Transcript_8268/g.34578  ORF Transcript_8268/g.34578 Transcript_8268/m.34578 type:complete len:225 (+) Transcript_8268:573-1247(+)
MPPVRAHLREGGQRLHALLRETHLPPDVLRRRLRLLRAHLELLLLHSEQGQLVLQLLRPLRPPRRHPPLALSDVGAAQGRGRLRRAGQAGHSRRARHAEVSVAERASRNADSFRVDAGGAGRRGELVSPRLTCNTTRALHLLAYLGVASARHASRARLLPETSNRRTARVLCTSSRRVTNCPTLVAPSYTRRRGGVPTRLVSSSSITSRLALTPRRPPRRRKSR